MTDRMPLPKRRTRWQKWRTRRKIEKMRRWLKLRRMGVEEWREEVAAEFALRMWLVGIILLVAAVVAMMSD